jgi:hypothetical protein
MIMKRIAVVPIVGTGCRAGVTGRQAKRAFNPPILLLVSKAKPSAAKPCRSGLDRKQLSRLRRAAFACRVNPSSFRAYILFYSSAAFQAKAIPCGCRRALSPLKKILFLKCCTLSPYTHATLQPSSKNLFFALPPSLFVYLQVSLQPATMPMRHAKRQPVADLTSVPSASGISGSQTASSPTGTSLLSNTFSGTSNTDVPDFVPGFVSMCLIPVPPF